MKIYLVWNESKTECIGFTDQRDAEQAAGLRGVFGSAASLAEFFRSNYADEDIFDNPVQVFEIQEIDA